MVRRIALALGLVVAALAPPGCTTWEGGIPGYFKNRVKDALDMVDMGVTVSSKSHFALYKSFMSIAPAGYGRLDGTFIGIGAGDIGAMRISYDNIGLLAWGRERIGWGECIWSFPAEVDADTQLIWDYEGVGVLGLLSPPWHGRPAGRPT